MRPRARAPVAALARPVAAASGCASLAPSPHSPCRTAFNEYQLCVDKRGKTDLLCLQRGRDYTAICPAKWIETWKGHADAGISMSVGAEYVK